MNDGTIMIETVKETKMHDFAKGGKVIFYGTCLVDMTAPQSGLAAIKILEKLGYQVLYPTGQTCCSQPAFNSGYREAARSVAEKQLPLLDADCPIIVPSGSCAAMLKHHLVQLFQEHPMQEQAKKISHKVFEWADFVEKSCASFKIKLTDSGVPVKVVLHVSCHAQREMQVTKTTKELLQRLENVEVLKIPEEEVCCGFGGTFSIKHSDISAQMLKRKINAIEGVAPDYLISSDMGCLLQIAGMLKKSTGSTPQAMHLADFLWQRISQ